ncbi:hypothetical protein [Domibacillus robiginosus]|uniref:hypothetical protein n=1 Tax=Domibacillus robiginosus TaxID=1071054 RepID=UPI00067B098B|nr:hypothetical protein [Domibacillus robiginosus]
MEEAKELAEPIEQKGMAVYVKELPVPMTNDIKKQLLLEKDQQSILDLLKQHLISLPCTADFIPYDNFELM